MWPVEDSSEILVAADEEVVVEPPFVCGMTD